MVNSTSGKKLTFTPEETEIDNKRQKRANSLADPRYLQSSILQQSDVPRLLSSLLNSGETSSQSPATETTQKVESTALPVISPNSSHEKTNRSNNFNNNNSANNNNSVLNPNEDWQVQASKLFQTWATQGNPSLFPEAFISLFGRTQLIQLLKDLSKNPSANFLYYILLKKTYENGDDKSFRTIVDYLAQNFPKALLENRFERLLEKVFNDPKWSDCKLIIVCKRKARIEISVIGSLLKYQSEYFKKLLEDASPNGEIRFPNSPWRNTHVDVVKILIKFCCCSGKVAVHDEAVFFQLLELANLFVIPTLRKECDKWIKNYGHWGHEDKTYENIYCWGRMHSAVWKREALAQAARQFVLKGSAQNPQVKEFLLLHKDEVEDLPLHLNQDLTKEELEQGFSYISQYFPGLKKLELSSDQEKSYDVKNLLCKLKSLEKLTLINISYPHVLADIRELKALKSIQIEGKVSPDELNTFFPLASQPKKLILKLETSFPLNSLHHVTKMSQLRHLEIQAKNDVETQQSTKVPLSFSCLTKLEYLSLPRPLIPEEIEELGQLKNLQHLHLIYQNTSLSQLAQLKLNLSSLHLDFTMLAIDDLQFLHAMPFLRKLKLSKKQRWAEITPNMAPWIASSLAKIPNLKELEVSNFLNSPGVEWIPLWIDELERQNRHDQIESLTIGCWVYEKNTFSSLSKLTGLKKLVVHVSDRSPNDIFWNPNSPQRNFLNLHGLTNPLLEKLHFIRHINFESDLHFLDSSEKISLENVNLTSDSLLSLRLRYPFLKTCAVFLDSRQIYLLHYCIECFCGMKSKNKTP